MQATTETTRGRLRRLLEIADDHDLYVTASHEYSEPGYTDPDSGFIFFGNWNPRCGFSASEAEQRRDIRVRFSRVADKLGADLQWDDEWATCHDCNAAVRTEPDSYSWTQSYVISDDGLSCKTCLIDAPDSYVDDFLLNRTDTADTFDVDLTLLGFRQIEKGENGWHPGQTDDPTTMAKHVPADHDFVFQIDAVGQFDTRFSLWVRPNDYTDDNGQGE